MKRIGTLIGLVLLVAVALLSQFMGGCGDSESGAKHPENQGASDTGPSTKKEVDTSQAETSGPPGVLAGQVLFEGKLPPPRRIQVNKDEKECGHAAGEIQDVVVSVDKGLSGVVVEILKIKPPEGWPPAPPEGGYTIRQRGCHFSPHLLVVPVDDGAELTVYNDDPVLHNINTGQWNVSQPPGTSPMKKRLDYEGQSLVRVNCNIHSWMESWVYLARSPYYAVTAADGRFRIENVPPGNYKVTATHPTLGTEKFQITVGSGQTVERDVRFGSR